MQTPIRRHAAAPTKLYNIPQLIIHANLRTHAELILVAFLGLMYFRVSLAVLVLGRTRCIDLRGIVL